MEFEPLKTHMLTAITGSCSAAELANWEKALAMVEDLINCK